MSLSTNVVEIARCPRHGLHGQRKRCFKCGKAVEQVRMIALDDLIDNRVCNALIDELVVSAGGQRGYTTDKLNIARWDMAHALRVVLGEPV